MNTPSRERIAQVLLHQVDLTFQRCYHQSLNDIVQDLSRHNLLRSPNPSPDMLLTTIRDSGILRLNASRSVRAMKAALDRYALGTLETCLRCGRMIDSGELEVDAVSPYCSGCRESDH